MKKYIGELYITKRWYLLMGGITVLLFASFFFDSLYFVSFMLLLCLAALTIADYMLLFFLKGELRAHRIMPARFSLGDENTVMLSLFSTLPFEAGITLIDELPEQFQERNFRLATVVSAGKRQTTNYTLRLHTRGAYSFGYLNAYIKTPLSLLQRRTICADEEVVKVYPSYRQLKKYQLLAVADSPAMGVKKIRRLGHSMEFEKIKDYVNGDDVRTINWKATARNGNLMVNMFTDTRQQQVYCLIDKGRAMKMPFEGMTLLDYSINAALALLNVALLRQDRAGLITFANKVGDVIPAERRNDQMHRILEALYRQQTDFKESDYEAVWAMMHKSIPQRSLVLLFTNFETYSSLERQSRFLKKMAQRHLVCVIFFQNTLLKEIQQSQPDTTEGIYIKIIAEQFDLEKKLIAMELRRQGILSILTTPQSLTIDVVNKYLEIKAKQLQ